MSEIEQLRRSLLDMAHVALGLRELPDGRWIFAEVVMPDGSLGEALTRVSDRVGPVQEILARHGGTVDLTVTTVPLREYLEATIL